MNTAHKSNFLSQSRNYLFTSESVSEGHPDKIADQISDRILDEFLARDPNARVACETVLADQFVLVAGEFKTADQAIFEAVHGNAEKIVRQALREIGYTSKEDGIDPDKCEVKIAFNRQSIHINQGVDLAGGEIGAGDQGLMFGYACDETPELMPLAISLAHKLVRKQAELRKSGVLPWLRPDAKSQVSVRYVDGKPVAVEKVVLSTQHAPEISTDFLREAVRREIVEQVIPVELRGGDFEVLINPTGRFEVGGPNGDTGLTGRKIIVDTYGGSCPHGGGAFSGKDPSKVDRSAAYMARYIAKNIVAAGLATRCLVQLAYAIGLVEPVSVMVDTYGTGKLLDEELEVLVRGNFELTPKGIIDSLNLKQPIYAQTAAYGHFGREGFSWEKTNKTDVLKLCFPEYSTPFHPTGMAFGGAVESDGQQPCKLLGVGPQGDDVAAHGIEIFNGNTHAGVAGVTGAGLPEGADLKHQSIANLNGPFDQAADNKTLKPVQKEFSLQEFSRKLTEETIASLKANRKLEEEARASVNTAKQTTKTECNTNQNDLKLKELIIKDQKNLSSFVGNLNSGVKFSDLDDELKSWWLNRY